MENKEREKRRKKMWKVHWNIVIDGLRPNFINGIPITITGLFYWKHQKSHLIHIYNQKLEDEKRRSKPTNK